MGFVPMKFTVRWLINKVVAIDLGRHPTAQELADYTKRNPDHFPEPWDVETAQYALDHPDQILNEEAS